MFGWPNVLSNAVDSGWVRTKMGGPEAPVDIETGQRTQAWLAVSDDPAAMVSGRYWHHLQQEQPARKACNLEFQDQLILRLSEMIPASHFLALRPTTCDLVIRGPLFPSRLAA
jgi:hypothetical protein